MLELDVSREFTKNVVVYGPDGEVQGDFDATFVTVPVDIATSPENKSKRMVDLCVKSVNEEQLKLKGADGEYLKGADLLAGVCNDRAISSALLRVYEDVVGKKNLQPTL